MTKNAKQELKQLIREMIKEEIVHYFCRKKDSNEPKAASSLKQAYVVLGSPQIDPEKHNFPLTKPHTLPHQEQPFQPNFSHLENRPYLSRLVRSSQI